MKHSCVPFCHCTTKCVTVSSTRHQTAPEPLMFSCPKAATLLRTAATRSPSLLGCTLAGRPTTKEEHSHDDMAFAGRGGGWLHRILVQLEAPQFQKPQVARSASFPQPGRAGVCAALRFLHQCTLSRQQLYRSEVLCLPNAVCSRFPLQFAGPSKPYTSSTDDTDCADFRLHICVICVICGSLSLSFQC